MGSALHFQKTGVGLLLLLWAGAELALASEPTQIVDVPQRVHEINAQLKAAQPPCDPASGSADSPGFSHTRIVGGDGPPPTVGSAGLIPLTFDLQSPLKDYECSAWFASGNAYQPTADVYQRSNALGIGAPARSGGASYNAQGANRQLQLGCKKKNSKNTFFDFRFTVDQLGKPNCWIDHFACGEFIEAFHNAIGANDPFGRVASNSLNVASLNYCKWESTTYLGEESCRSRSGNQIYFGTLSAGFAGLYDLISNERVRVSAGGSLTLGVGNTFLKGITPQAGATGGVLASVALDKAEKVVLTLRASAGVVVSTDQSFGVRNGNAVLMGSAEVGLKTQWSNDWSTTLSLGYFEKTVPQLAERDGWAWGDPLGRSVERTANAMRGGREGNITGAIETCWTPCSCVSGRLWEGLNPRELGGSLSSWGEAMRGSNNEMDFGTSLSLKGCFGD